MSYDITIGERIQEWQMGKGNVTIGAKSVKIDTAPTFGEPTDYTNERWPSYLAWDQFMKAINVNHKVLINSHPGYVKVTKDMVLGFDQIKNSWIEKHPNSIAGFNAGQDYILARLEWLTFWLNWAIKNCEHPIIYNS